MTYQLSRKSTPLQGEITLDGSKSISNRALLIRALAGEHFPIHRLGISKDVELMQTLLAQHQTTAANAIFDAGAAGTTFRFMTAFLAMQAGEQTLTGTERMKQRPIGILVDALRKLGANIDFLEKDNYPPLKIKAPNLLNISELSIAANTSSQYISALLMLAPNLPNGLKLTLEGKIVSRSYIEMTLALMQHFGVAHQWEGQTISIAPQAYQAQEFTVEADWSAASYYYSMAAIAEEVDLQLNGLFEQSVQGDSVLPKIYEKLGVRSIFNENGVHLSKTGISPQPILEHNFLLCPDIAQTVAVTCAALGVTGMFTGLETLYIKETDRIAAVQNELGKVQAYLSKLPGRLTNNSEQEHFMLEGKAQVISSPTFATYEDHRMAMAFAPLSMLGTIRMAEPMVVNKSYPNFWRDLAKIGFEIVEI